MSAKVATPVKKATTPKAKPTHPAFAVMINDAIKKMAETRTGSTKQSISKFICANYTVDLTDNKKNSHFKKALNQGVETGNLKQVSGTGANGRFKIGETAKNAEKLKAKKEKEAAKPTKEVKKVVKKTVVKESATATKKAITKKDATKTIIKKATKADAKPKKNVHKPIIVKVTAKKALKSVEKKAPAKTQKKIPNKKVEAKKAPAKKSSA